MQSTMFLPRERQQMLDMLPCESLVVGELAFGTQLEHGPSTPAEPNRTELFEAVFLLQRFGEVFDLGKADLL